MGQGTDVVATPRRTEIIGIRPTLVLTDESNGMSGFTIKPSSLVNAFRKKHTYVYLRMDFRIVRRISVKHVVFALYHVLITVQYHAGCQSRSRRQPRQIS